MQIAERTGSTIQYLHQDLLGSTRLKTNSTGGQVYSSNYQPYGVSQGESGSETFRYTGKPEDDASGLYYYGARYYDPNIARFITSDTNLGSLSDPQSLNRYIYCRDNPMKYTDPDGHVFFLIPAGYLISFAVFLGYVSISPYIPTIAHYISSVISPITPNIGRIYDPLIEYTDAPYRSSGSTREEEKWKKHEEDFSKYYEGENPLNNVDEYKDLWEKTNDYETDHNEDIREYERADGIKVFYDKRNNLFGLENPDGSFNNLYPPSDYMDYYLRDELKHIGNSFVPK